MIGGSGGDLVANQTVHGGDVDDPAIAGGDHGLVRHGTGHLEGAEQVDVQLILELGVGDLLRGGHSAGTGVVDENVDAAHFLHHLIDGRLHAVSIGDITDNANGLDAILLLQHGGVLLHLFLPAGKADNVGALAGKCLGHLNTQAGGAACHKGDSICKIKIVFHK